MKRARISVGVFATAAVAAITSAQAEEARTTRIEPNASYGATVTIEEGVRVFRPLPSERHVIVNPQGATALGLGYYQVQPGVPVPYPAPTPR